MRIRLALLAAALILSGCTLRPLYSGGSSGPVAQALHGVQVAPMAPHVAEEAWAALGGDGLVADAAWPKADPDLLVDEEVTIAVQVNGKLRDTLPAPKGASREALEELALASEKVVRILDGQVPRKVIVVPDRLVNIVA